MTNKLAVALVALSSCAAIPAQAQQRCATTDEAYSVLSEKYGETRIVQGFTAEGAQVEFWLNPQGGSWSLLITAAGATCLFANGADWSFDDRQKEPNL